MARLTGLVFALALATCTPSTQPFRGEAGFTFGMEPAAFESTCRGAGGSVRRKGDVGFCDGLQASGELARDITDVHGVFIEGRLARLILYSKEEPGPISKRIAARFRCKPGTHAGECIFAADASIDDGAALDLESRAAFGRAGSALTVVSQRSIDAARQMKR